MSQIEFENRQFKTRDVNVRNEGIKAISSLELNKILFQENGDYKSDEARFIDEQIYFFVDSSKLKLDDRLLSAYVKKHCV
jgi:hypothetical protein